MKYLYACFFVLILFTCKTKSELAVINNKPSHSLCPEAGTCTFEVLQNNALMINYNKLGELYPTIIEGSNLVLKFEYKKKEIADALDSGYREELFVELENNNLDFVTSDFKSQKVIFARWCYCKGQTGYYKIKEGELLIKKLSDQTYQLKLDFKVKEVPQVITSINEIFSLKN